MADELHARYRELLAERQRREVQRPPADPLRELVAALHKLFTTPPDQGHQEEHDR